MAAIAGLNDLINRLSGGAGATESIFFWKYPRYTNSAGTPNQTPAGGSGFTTSLWMGDGNPSGSNIGPSTAVVPTNATLGALGQTDPGGGREKFIVQVAAVVGQPGLLWIYDRLSHQGGLVGNLATPQTTNLPTAALTRYTTGDGCIAWVETYDQVGGTTVNFSVSYTNQAGTSGRTSPSVSLAASSTGLNRMNFIPLLSPDSGIRSVESVTLAATTGAAGYLGVTIGKPLAVVHMNTWPPSGLAQSGGGSRNFTIGLPDIPKVFPGACLALAWTPAYLGGAYIGGDLQGAITMVEA